MKKVTPYKTTRNAMAALDNGGRFYNWASTAQDGSITPAELKKAAGVFSGMQNAMIFLEMSLANFDGDERRRVLSFLTRELKAKYDKYQPEHPGSATALEALEAGDAAVVTGKPRPVDSKTEFSGFIMIPISTGKTTTFSMVPIIEEYTVYELLVDGIGGPFYVGHHRTSRKLPEQRLRLGGVFKELKASPDGKPSSDRFLEITHYTPLD